MTGNVCRNSPESTTVIPAIDDLQFIISCNVISIAFKALLCAIVHSPKTIRSHFLRTWAVPESLGMLETGVSMVVKSKGYLKEEWAVQPPQSSVAAMTD